jgi:hypothetical protein
MRWLLLIGLATGCAHVRGDGIANALFTAAIIAVEVSQLPQPPPGPLCDDDPGNPPHRCPGTAPAPSEPPPPPPE